MSFQSTEHSRRICWPSFDKVCLQGGCLYCDDYRMRSWGTVERIAKSKGLQWDFVYGKVRATTRN